MTRAFIDGLLKEFAPIYHDGRNNNFNHVVRNMLAVAQVFDSLGHEQDSKVFYDRVRKYVKLLRGVPEFRERELAIPIHPDCDITIQPTEYIEVIYPEFADRLIQ